MPASDQKVKDAVAAIQTMCDRRPRIGIVLGSGLGDFGDGLHNRVEIDTSNIPHYPVSTVPGHAGRLVFGQLVSEGKTSADLLAFQGRIHFYECNDLEKVIFPIQVAAELGIETLILTNAAGGINKAFRPGDLMLIRDFINLTMENPLRGISPPRTASAGNGLDADLLSLARSIAHSSGVQVKEGVYCWTKGPSYESAAEIRMMALAGADAVGMSTMPEVMVATQHGMKVLGVSCITNYATGLTDAKLDHQEVTDVANMVKANFTELLTKIVLALP
ncbi:MAG: purine-nucleoside phosphorylase [Ignavibacteriales bacterium]|nr:purine-nucleoside phosphorylase [Ignavibacteriales bacterium]